MIDLKTYLETFISDPDMINIILGLMFLLVVMVIAKALGCGIFKS